MRGNLKAEIKAVGTPMSGRGDVEAIRGRSGQQPVGRRRLVSVSHCGEALWLAIQDFVFRWEGFSCCNGNNKRTLIGHLVCPRH